MGVCADLLRSALRNSTYKGVRIHEMSREELKCNAVAREIPADPTRSSSVPSGLSCCAARVRPLYASSTLRGGRYEKWGEGTCDLEQGDFLPLRASPGEKCNWDPSITNTASSLGLRASVLKGLGAADHNLHHRVGKKLA